MTWGQEEVFHQIKVSDTDLTLWCAACRASQQTHTMQWSIQPYTHTVIHMSHCGVQHVTQLRPLLTYFPIIIRSRKPEKPILGKRGLNGHFPNVILALSCNYQISLITIVGTPSPNYPLTLLSLYKILINHLCSSHISLCVLVEIVISTLLCLTLFLRRNWWRFYIFHTLLLSTMLSPDEQTNFKCTLFL